MSDTSSKILGLTNLQIAFIAVIIAALALLCSIWYNRIFKKTYKLAKLEHESKLSNFSVYLVDAFRLSINDSSKKYILFNITVSNKSTSKYSFAASLEIQYVRSDNSREHMLFDYIDLDIKSVIGKKLTFFPRDIKLDEKTLESKWLVFEYPINILKSYRIEKYIVKIKDIEGNYKNSEVFLLKDIKDEN
ncbi:MAG TPA: hypothetical protein VGI43_19855 [Mucilaginibacter sp.]